MARRACHAVMRITVDLSIVDIDCIDPGEMRNGNRESVASLGAIVPRTCNMRELIRSSR